MIIQRSDHFKKCFKKLPKEIQNLFEEKIKLLIESNFSHLSLRIKKMKETAKIWEGSVTMNYRFTFELIEGGIFLRKIGTHNILKTP